MGTVCSSLFQSRRDEDMPDGNGGGSRQDTDLEGSITEGVEIDARNCRTHNIDQIENKGKCRDTGESQAQKDGSEAPNRGKKRGATTATNARKRTKTSKNWTLAETQTLIGSRLQPSLEKGKLEWEAISVQIPGRTGKQCQQRWDTVVMPYKKIKRHCDTHGEDFGQVTDEEFRRMNVDNHWRNGDWYTMIDEYYRSRASAAAVIEGAADLDTMEPPASTSTAVGDADGSEDPLRSWTKVLLDSAQ